MKLILAISTLFLFVACASGPLNVEQQAAIKNVAVVSYLNEEVPMEINNGEPGTLNAKNWALNSYLVNEFQRRMQAAGKSGKKVSLDSVKLSQARTEDGNNVFKKMYTTNEATYKYAQAEAGKSGAEYWIQIRPIAAQNLPFFPGLGLTCNNGFGGSGKWMAYINMQIALMEVQTGKAIFTKNFVDKDLLFLSQKTCEELQNANDSKWESAFKSEFQILAAKAVDAFFLKSGLGKSTSPGY